MHGLGSNVTLAENYVLGTPFDIQIKAENGIVYVSYNGEQKFERESSYSTCYFKAGNYSLSNVKDKGENPNHVTQISIYSLSFSHS